MRFNTKHGVRIMSKIRILAIAPYEGLRNLLNRIAKERNDIDMDCFVSDMQDELLLAKELEHQNYDIIMSRAGTAQLLREESILPVIDVNLSPLDMMRAIELAQGYSGEFAIVGYNGITNIAKHVCELFKYDTAIKTVHSPNEIDTVLLELKNSGIGLVLGDVITTTRARKFGLNTILITTGQETIIRAIDSAVMLYSSIQMSKDRNLIIEKILAESDSSVICFNENGTILYSNLKEDIRHFSQLISDLRDCKKSLIENENIRILKTYNNTIFWINGVIIEHKNKQYLTYYIEKQSNIVKVFDKAIDLINIGDSPQIISDTFNSSSEVYRNLTSTAKAYATVKSPIIIIGERGTGKDTIAYTIYQNSINNKNPLITIDAKYISDEKWLELFESERSSLLNNDFTIYIKNIHLLSEHAQNMFESYLLSSDIHRRNKMLFSMVKEVSPSFDKSSLLYFIKNKLAALPLTVPSLNERKEDLPNLISLYLNELNLIYDKQIVGLEDEAMGLIQDFNWEGNIDQLKRVMRQLIILTDNSHIKYDTVKQVLNNENLRLETSTVYNINLNNTLDQITKDIINIVMKEENYNQSKTAKRLGISRSTLWRKIK